MSQRVLRLDDLMQKVRLGKTAIAEKQNPKSPYYDPTFPKSFSLGERAVGYLESDVDIWISAQIAKSVGNRLKQAVAKKKLGGA